MSHDQIKKIVADYIYEFMQNGYNRKQATSLAWSAYYENHSRSYILGISSPEFHCSCQDCNKGNKFGAADSVRLFIDEHKDHNTWTRVVR